MDKEEEQSRIHNILLKIHYQLFLALEFFIDDIQVKTIVPGK